MLNSYGVDFTNTYLQPAGFKWGNGEFWNDAALRAGISVDDFPIPGDIAYWEDGNYGHVAFVEKVYYDENGNFTVTAIDYTQYNVTACSFSEEIRMSVSDSDYPDGFIHILAYNEGVTSLHYLDCSEMGDLCSNQTPEEWSMIVRKVWNEYRCRNCTSDYDLAYIDSIAGGFGGSSGDTTYDPQDPPNLKVREIKVYNSNGNLLTERESILIPGEILDIQINIISLEEDCSNGIAAGKDTVETDLYKKIALGDDLGNYEYLGRVYSEVERLYEDNHHIEHFSYTVPTEAAGQRIYIRAQADATDEVTEINEDDNWSGTDEWYAVAGDCDIIISEVSLTNGKTELSVGEHYGVEAFITNQGSTTCPFSTRLIYYHQKPGENTWTELATDGTDVAELVPGFIKHEYTTGEPFVADTPGVHKLIACGDYLNDQLETNEANNCVISTFTVNANKPNLYVHKIYFKVGSATYQNGATIARNSYVKPYVQIGNNGTSGIHPPFRVAYYVNADKYRDSDGVDANQVCIGCIVTEYVSEGFKLGDKGTRTYKVCLDYQGNVAEGNETDNCQTITFYVK